MTLPPFAADEKIFLAVNGLGGQLLDYLCGWPTYFGDPVAVSLAVFAYMLIWDRGPVFRRFAAILAGTMGGWLLAQAGKALVYRPRPYLYFLERIEGGTAQIHSLFGLLAKESSLPSGHTATIFACAVIVNRFYGPKFRFMYAVAAFVGFTRIYVGVHFPSDVLVGALFGIAAGEAAALAAFRLKIA